MAAIFTPSKGTLPSPDNAQPQNGTTPTANQPEDGFELEREDDALEFHRAGALDGTLSKINKGEKGSPATFDAAADAAGHEFDVVSASRLADDRRQIARRLCQLMDRILESHKKAKMAADLALLKRELSRCHETLGSASTESNYLSIVTLVESNLASMDWKKASKTQLKRVQDVLAIGVQQTSVTFDDYNKAVKVIRGQLLPTGPTFELDFDEDDLNAE